VRGTARVGSDLQVAGRVVGSDLKALFAAARHRAGLLVDGPHADGSLGDLVGLDDGVVPPGRFSRSARNPNTSAVGLRIITVFSKVAQPLLSDAERLSAFTGLPASSDTPSPLAELLSSLSAGATAGTSEPTLPTRCAGRCSPGLCQAVELGGCPRVVPPCPRSFRSVVVRPVSNLVSIGVPIPSVADASGAPVVLRDQGSIGRPGTARPIQASSGTVVALSVRSSISAPAALRLTDSMFSIALALRSWQGPWVMGFRGTGLGYQSFYDGRP
jgi:hypothetical protein